MWQYDEAILHPVYNKAFTSSEHPEGQYHHIGDALGRDCMVHKFVDGWMKMYEGNGMRNEDWYGWLVDVLAPFNGIIEEIHLNPITNMPGIINESRSSSIVFSRDDGVKVVYAHVMGISVNKGDFVKAGDVVAKVGNNGYSRHPHIHIGAWKGKVPLQIRFDLHVMGQQLKNQGQKDYLL